MKIVNLTKIEEVLKTLDELAGRSNQIELYKSDLRVIMKGIGRVIGKFDSELLEFLKHTNGATVFDYCFMGFKNPKLGVDIDKFMMELWPSNSMLAGRFLPFMGTSTSDNFGYLIDIIDEKGRHPIAYYSDLDRERVHVIASSFQKFSSHIPV